MVGRDWKGLEHECEVGLNGSVNGLVNGSGNRAVVVWIKWVGKWFG